VAVVAPLIPALGEFLNQPILGLDGGFYLLAPLAIGCLLAALADPLIRLYEGVYTFQRSFLLKPLLRSNQKQHDELYANLITLKQTYVNEKDGVKRQSLMRRIGQEHRRLFESRQTDALPYDNRRLLPTRLGNAWAVIEEYPAYRYGMDGVTFWPRLRACVPKDYLETIDSENTYIRFMINLSFTLSCFGLESIIVAFIVRGFTVAGIVPIILGVGAFFAAYVLYRAAAALTRSMGELIKSCFDLYRHELLRELGIDWEPETRMEERKMWIGLANYLVTGEDVYYPKSPKVGEEPVQRRSATMRRPPSDYLERVHVEVAITEYGANAPLDVLMVASEAVQMAGSLE
jgi:hypothetical protein